MKLTKISMALGVAALITACDESSSVVEASATTAETYTSKDSIPDCDKKYEGQFAIVPSKKEMYVCSNGEWINMVGKVSESEPAAKLSCNTEELKDKSGLKIVCNGDSIGVVKNGQNGEKAEVSTETIPCTVEQLADSSAKVTCGETSVVLPKGKQGTQGLQGLQGEKGTFDESTLKDQCKTTYAGLDVVIYNCDGVTYTSTIESSAATSLKFATWTGLRQSPFLCSAYDGMGMEIDPKKVKLAKVEAPSPVGEVVEQVAYGEVISDDDEGPCFGTWFTWADGEGNPSITWANVDIDPSSASSSDLVEASLEANSGFVGEMALSGKGAAAGMYIEFDSEKNLKDLGGFCITYSSEKEMIIGIYGDAPIYLTAKLPATNKKETTVNILWKDFDVEFNALAKLANSGTDVEMANYILTEAYGIDIYATNETEAESYTNAFGIFEFGGYGNCAGLTIESLKLDEGTVKDDRDGKEYKTITIGTQTWMAENMAYQPMDGEEDLSKCSEDADACAILGRHYDWKTAMESVCPEGWHVPSKAEWNKLEETVSNIDKGSLGLLTILGSKEYWGGMDLLGFDLRPGGVVWPGDDNISSVGTYSTLWLSDEYSRAEEELAYMVEVYNYYGYYTGRYIQAMPKEDTYANVRCLKD